MANFSIKKLSKKFDITIENIASDKSISHRCAMFALFSDKTSYIKNYLTAEDTLNTLNIVEQLGAKIKRDGSSIEITPSPKLIEPENILDCGNSGTAMRLFCGLLASVDGAFVLSGDKYLRSRPMKRVAEPLRAIKAQIDGRENGNKAPLFIRGEKNLEAFTYISPVDSAQVKSAMILAALRATNVSRYKENELTRDHTERMLKGMGAEIFTDDEGFINIKPLTSHLKALNMTVPADPSSGFFFALAAAINKGSRVIIKNASLNPTRIEAYIILKKMGATVNFIEKENIYEPIGDIEIIGNELNGIEVSKNISWLIDELPALAIAMSLAKGKSLVKNAKELRVKESDRIKAVVDNLKLCGVDYKEFEDGYEIIGGSLTSANIDSFGDHRIAMSFAIAGLISGMEIEDVDCINASFPNFKEILDSLYN
ncbi:3-phosphoshikimate 1-carboxyvinyltransferase [Aliarcobacter thereius]|uniref:3-phosphoshikimate 1-carboxyvinyltransferase n=1 Tax=Aliarcobacter thereius LMG 24486 TaxID=1032240 RepID=A0A1C7WMB9_9BACT|nr:3-phosphoshikimate 1-carboxyvinyltransferase [Aliarcobacter thereius]OCL92145.1 3-phosphoshikimate 1-carboxyvinyltransferase [Aliarcobacter thereius]OCL94759.1 3-phosphoshikimate 1-carboxyvinyltransferase [Aliarcobacter thereius LMG 24486]QBF15365.1 3-phosphoshikimate 1-carboxyvinyltransferase [Aliarcobacter thereius LMG 24486]TLS93182.1 3-phosphoshikimate 1-carboxyvinyltransferase [Aliarcobacter thereius]HJE02842.1 3-phosphoshikimate 1-carboxyvinyltransferase [Aliarcobacter thereius]